MLSPAQALQFEGPPRSVSLDAGTYMWVRLVRFTFDRELADEQLIESLVAHRAFRVQFYDDVELGEELVGPDSVHGPYRLSRVHPGRFERVDAATAEAELFAWANDQQWTPPYAGQSAETMERLRADVCTLFRRGNVYRLSGLTMEDYAEPIFLGVGGFVEFVVIDRDAGVLHLVVATDD